MQKSMKQLRGVFFLFFFTVLLQTTVKAQVQLVKVLKSRCFVSSGSI